MLADFPPWITAAIGAIAGGAGTWAAFRAVVKLRLLEHDRRLRALESRIARHSDAFHALDKQVAVAIAVDEITAPMRLAPPSKGDK